MNREIKMDTSGAEKGWTMNLNHVCGFCKLTAAHMVAQGDTDGSILRQMVCDVCGRRGRLKKVADWMGVENEARALLYAPDPNAKDGQR